MTKDRPLPKITKLPYMGNVRRVTSRREHDEPNEDEFGLYGSDASLMRFERTFKNRK